MAEWPDTNKRDRASQARVVRMSRRSSSLARSTVRATAARPFRRRAFSRCDDLRLALGLCPVPRRSALRRLQFLQPVLDRLVLLAHLVQLLAQLLDFLALVATLRATARPPSRARGSRDRPARAPPAPRARRRPCLRPAPTSAPTAAIRTRRSESSSSSISRSRTGPSCRRSFAQPPRHIAAPMRACIGLP